MPRRYKAIILLGIIVFVMPFLGFPQTMSDIVIAVASAIIVFIAFARGRAGRTKDSDRAEAHTSFTENSNSISEHQDSPDTQA